MDIDRLRKALIGSAGNADESGDDVELEMSGDAAFDWLIAEVSNGKLSPRETVRGLRLLSRLTRQFCVARKGELMDLGLGIVRRTGDQYVRSAALHILILNVGIARGLRDPHRSFGRSPEALANEVLTAAREAAERGLDDGVMQLTEQFLEQERR